MYMRRTIQVLLGIVAFCGIALSVFSQQVDVDFTVSPATIETHFFYNGTTLEIEGRFPPCDGVAVLVTGNNGSFTLNKKGKIGPLWMTVAQLTVADAPRSYILASSEELGTLCSTDELRKIGLGYGSLRNTLSFSSESPLDGHEFEQFIQFQEDHGFYGADIGGDLTPQDAARGELSATVFVPSAVPSGQYTCYLYCMKDGVVVVRQEKDISIVQAGIPDFMSGLAFNHAPLYGVVAIIIAMAAGVLMGMAFSFLVRGGR